jgi:hypothetical protein
MPFGAFLNSFQLPRRGFQDSALVGAMPLMELYWSPALVKTPARSS